MTSQHRKRLFIHKAIQGSLVLRFAIHWLLFAGLTCCLLIVLQMLFSASMTAELRSQQIRLTIISFGLVSIALLPAFSYDLLRLSNRFVGPIMRLHNYLRHLDPKAIKPFCIRKGDYWPDLVQDVNRAVDRLRVDTAMTRVSQPDFPSDTLELVAGHADHHD